jgi:hypothetical protein
MDRGLAGLPRPIILSGATHTRRTKGQSRNFSRAAMLGAETQAPPSRRPGAPRRGPVLCRTGPLRPRSPERGRLPGEGRAGRCLRRFWDGPLVHRGSSTRPQGTAAVTEPSPRVPIRVAHPCSPLLTQRAVNLADSRALVPLHRGCEGMLGQAASATGKLGCG